MDEKTTPRNRCEQEILGYRAVLEIVHESFEYMPITANVILQLHKKLYSFLPTSFGGVFKTTSNEIDEIRSDGTVVVKFKPLEPFETHDAVDRLCKAYNEIISSGEIDPLVVIPTFIHDFLCIHPFNDGNGRTGRLWQTALLASWKPIFAWIPIESIIKDNQEDYYNAITLSTSQGKSNIFIEFMLDVINKAIKDIITDTRNHYNHINNQITELMKVIESYPQSATELMEKLNLKSRLGFRKNYLQPALDAGLIGMTEPDKLTSKNQKYFKI